MLSWVDVEAGEFAEARLIGAAVLGKPPWVVEPILQQIREHNFTTQSPSLLKKLVVNQLRQLPILESVRLDLVDLIESWQVTSQSKNQDLNAVRILLQNYPPVVPTKMSSLIQVHDEWLRSALALVADLDRTVPGPWTVIGGLMVVLHQLEVDASLARRTMDVDLAVGAFTHRGTLRLLSERLASRGFIDVSHSPISSGAALSFRWRRDDLGVDLLVPAKVNRQRWQSRTVSRLPAMEKPGLQQAIARTEKIAVFNGESSRVDFVRRPNIAGAIVMKCLAVVSDQRNVKKHAIDLRVLTFILRNHSALQYHWWPRPKDRRRVLAACRVLEREADWVPVADDLRKLGLGPIQVASGRDSECSSRAVAGSP